MLTVADERQYLRRIPGVPDRCEPVSSLAERLRKATLMQWAAVDAEIADVVEAAERHHSMAVPSDCPTCQVVAALARRMDEEGL